MTTNQRRLAQGDCITALGRTRSHRNTAFTRQGLGEGAVFSISSLLPRKRSVPILVVQARCAMVAVALVLCAVIGLLGGGCATPSTKESASGTTQAQAKLTDIHSKSGAQLWGERCGFCHNVRSPTSFSDAQWEVATLHMRVRANLTGEERRKILEFLKSAD